MLSNGLKTMRTESALLHRWSAALEEYDFTVQHRPGKIQTHVYGLSRPPVDPELQKTPYYILRWKMRRKLAAWHRSCTQPRISAVKLCGSCSVTAIPTKQAVESVLRWPRVAHSIREGVTMAIARRPRAPLSPKAPWDTLSVDIVGPLPADRRHEFIIVFVIVLAVHYTSACQQSYCRHSERCSVAPCRAILWHPSPPLIRSWQRVCWRSLG